MPRSKAAPAAVFLDYTQEELDRNFDQRRWAANALEVIERYGSASRATRSDQVAFTDVCYGPGKNEMLDIFPASNPDTPVLIFIHGGAWLNFSKDDFSFVAAPFADRATTVVVNFSNLPKVRLPDMIDQVRRAVAWVHGNVSEFGGDATQLYLAGWSSGAHLAANVLESDWATLGLPQVDVRGATLVSGVYDLEPVMLSARSSYVFLSPAETIALSANKHVARMGCSVQVVYAEGDTDEFQRQSKSMAESLDGVGCLRSLTRVDRLNHFEIMESFGQEGSVVARIIGSQLSLTR